MSYQLLSSQNTPTNIYLVFNEVTITKDSQVFEDYHQPGQYMFKKYRHADGSLNGTSDQMWLDSGTNSDPFVIPDFYYMPSNLLAGGYTSLAASFDKDFIVQNVKKYFEPFNVNVSEASTLPLKWDTSKRGSRYLKMIPPGFHISGDRWNALPPKFYPFKRATWWQRKESNAAFDCAHDWNNYATMGYGETDLEAIIMGTVHEIGHLYNLEHQGDQRDPIEMIQNGLSYYGNPAENLNSNPIWLPIMGFSTQRPVNQWSNSDYRFALVNGPPGARRSTIVYENEFEKMLEGGIKLVKPPGSMFKPTRPGPAAGELLLAYKVTKDPLYARYVTSNSSEVIGMIGYEKDYDILKILVPRGLTTITVEAYGDGKEDRSMLDPRIEILYCQSQLEKLALSSEQEYPEIWTSNMASIPSLKSKNIFHKVLIENDGHNYQPKNIHSVSDGVFNTSTRFFSSSLTVNTDYLTLVYVKVLGNWSGTVNPVTKKPLIPDEGYSNYGSVGKYKLKLSKTSLVGESSYNIPYGRFEEFSICKDGGQAIKKWLLVQDKYDNSQGDPSKNNMWVLELDTIENGQTKKKKFIVYGKPLEPGAQEVDGKFYLNVPINGVCKKQEFILGMPRPEEEEE